MYAHHAARQLESKLEAQERRYKEEAARVKAEYKKQGLTYGNERAAKASQNAEAEKAYLKDQLQLKESQVGAVYVWWGWGWTWMWGGFGVRLCLCIPRRGLTDGRVT